MDLFDNPERALGVLLFVGIAAAALGAAAVECFVLLQAWLAKRHRRSR